MLSILPSQRGNSELCRDAVACDGLLYPPPPPPLSLPLTLTLSLSLSSRRWRSPDLQQQQQQQLLPPTPLSCLPLNPRCVPGTRAHPPVHLQMHTTADAIRHVSPCALRRTGGDHDPRRRLVFEIRPANSSEAEAIATARSPRSAAPPSWPFDRRYYCL